MKLKAGDRVRISDGVLRGFCATVGIEPVTRRARDQDFYWLRFDERGKALGPEHGYAILNDQWFEEERLEQI